MTNVKLIIKGKRVGVPERATILEAEQRVGILIPALFSHRKGVFSGEDVMTGPASAIAVDARIKVSYLKDD